jgi:hypothetical protein
LDLDIKAAKRNTRRNNIGSKPPGKIRPKVEAFSTELRASFISVLDTQWTRTAFRLAGLATILGVMTIGSFEF